MCIAALAWNPGSAEPLLIAANRDEFRARPALPLARWDEGDIVGGRDLAAGGAWLAVRDAQPGTALRFGFVTNIRAPSVARGDLRTRGELVPAYLRAETSPLEHARSLCRDRHRYAGFNLLLGVIAADGAELVFLNSLEAAPRVLAPGLYCVSNATLDTPWPKVRRLRQALAHARAVHDRAEREQRLWRILADPTPAADAELPSTGLPVKWERALSSIFIASKDYGTRASTLLSVARDGRAWISERTWLIDRPPLQTTLVLGG